MLDQDSEEEKLIFNYKAFLVWTCLRLANNFLKLSVPAFETQRNYGVIFCPENSTYITHLIKLIFDFSGEDFRGCCNLSCVPNMLFNLKRQLVRGLNKSRSIYNSHGDFREYIISTIWLYQGNRLCTFRPR